MKRAGERCPISTRCLRNWSNSHCGRAGGDTASVGHRRISQEKDTTGGVSDTLVTLEAISFVETFSALKAVSGDRSGIQDLVTKPTGIFI